MPYSLKGKKYLEYREKAHMETLSLMAVKIQPSSGNAFEKDGKDHRRQKNLFPCRNPAFFSMFL